MEDSTSSPTFSLADYLVLASVLVISSMIGLYYRFSGGKQKTGQEFLMADKKASVLPVAFSLMASFMSAITLLGVTMENYTFGTQFVMINISYIISTPIAAYVFLPVFHRLQSASVYKYLERRFGYVTRLLASLAFTIQMTLYMGIVLYAPSLALSAVTGLNFVGSVISIGVVCTFYSTLGGMKAVLMTDVFQSLLMFAAIYTVIVRHTLWSQVFGGCFIYCSLYAVNQAQVQRLLSLPTLAAGQAALWIQVPILILLSLSTSFAGLCIFYHYRDCDPIKSGQIRSGDQLMPLYIVERMSQIPGLPGLAVAGIFSGSLSTVSSAINSLAAVTLEDYIRPCANNISDDKVSILVKVLAVFFGGICVALAFLADLLGTGVLQASLTIFGVVGGPLLGLFTLGVLCRRVEQVGAVTGFLSGLALVSWIGFGGPKPPSIKLPVSVANCSNVEDITEQIDEVPSDDQYFYLYRISYAWTSAIGFTMTVFVGVIVSEVFRKLTSQNLAPVSKHLLAQFPCRKQEDQDLTEPRKQFRETSY